MTLHDDEVSLRQMRDHAREALDLIRGRVRADLDADRVLSLAIIQLLQIVGEAGGRVSVACRERHADIPWRQIVGLRHRLVHGYDAIDHAIVWRVVSEDLPALVAALERIIGPPNGR
jgi:uncharacterized protein with HEPN domain